MMTEEAKDQKSPARVLLEPLVLSILAALVIRSVLQAYSIPSDSMSPTLETGDHILVTRYTRTLLSPEPRREDVVVFRLPGGNDEVYVKRVVAGPGDEIEIAGGRVLLNGQPLAERYASGGTEGALPRTTLPPGSYFVLGDNRGNSLDSRAWGPVSRQSILGRARIVFWSSGRGGPGENANAMAPPGTSPVQSRGIRWSRIFKIVE